MSGIVAGVDGSAVSRKALRWAFDQAEHTDAALTVVMAYSAEGEIPDFVGAYYTPRPYLEEQRQWAKQQAESLLREVVDMVVRERGGTTASYTLRAEPGPPAEVLLGHANTADHVVVGSRGNGGFKRLLLGSVSTAMVQHAPCPVTVVPIDPDVGES